MCLPGDKELVAAEAAKLRIAHQLDGFTAVGTALGSAEYVCKALGRRAATVETLVDTLVQLPLSVQFQFLLLCSSLQARMAHLMRMVPREVLATHMRRTDAAVWRAAAAVLDLPDGVGEYGADVEGPDKACSTLGKQMMLSLRPGGRGLHMQADEVSDATFVAGAGQAERNLKGRPVVLCPLQRASGASMRERWSSLNERYAEECKWDAATKDLQLVKRKGDDASHADMLSSFDLNTTQGQRDAARLRRLSKGPAGAFLPAIPGGCMTLGNDMFVMSVWHRLGHHVPADVAPPAVQMQCRRCCRSRSCDGLREGSKDDPDAPR